MKKSLYCKILTAGIILLFVGVSYSSAILVENELKIVENKDDCSCKDKVDNGICDFLVLYDEIISLQYIYLIKPFQDFLIETGNQIFAEIIDLYLDILDNRHQRIWEYAYYLDCWWIPPWYYPDSIE